MMRRRALIASGRLTEFTIIGNPVSFVTNVSENLIGFEIRIRPTQPGTEESSPENIRPIYGKTGITITKDNTNYIRNFLSTIYDAYYNVKTGELTPISKLYTWDITNASNWNMSGSSFFAVRRPSDFNQTTIGAWSTGIYKSNILGNTERSTNATGGMKNNGYYAGSSYITVRCDSMNGDLTTWRNFISTNTLQILALLTESARTPIYIDPLELQTISGMNIVSNNANDENTIIYLRRV